MLGIKEVNIVRQNVPKRYHTIVKSSLAVCSILNNRICCQKPALYTAGFPGQFSATVC